MFKHITILVPAVAKSFHANAENQTEWKASVQHCIKNNSGLIAKTKVKFINQTAVTNRKVSV